MVQNLYIQNKSNKKIQAIENREVKLETHHKSKDHIENYPHFMQGTIISGKFFWIKKLMFGFYHYAEFFSQK